MISAVECLYKLDQKLNKLSTQANQFIAMEDRLLALNEAQIEVVLSRIDLNNLYHIGFDGFRKRYEDLQNLVKPHEEFPLVKASGNIKYTCDLSQLTSKYLMYADIFIRATKGTCVDRVLAVNIIKHSDLQVKLANTNFKPSFEYQETIGTITSGSMEVYSDKTFTPTKLYISYITYPIQMDVAGYQKLDGSESVNSDSNLPDYMESEIVAVASRRLGGDTGNQEAVQNAMLTSSKAE